MLIPDPETDPVILALEREQAYATARHHEEMREQAEAQEQVARCRLRLLLPKVHGFNTLEKMITEWYFDGVETAEDLVGRLYARIRVANEEMARVANKIPGHEELWEDLGMF